MKKIISIIKPFDAKQKVYVYEDTELKDTIETDLETLPDTIIANCKLYDINVVDVVGIKAFSEKLKTALTSSKYDLNNLQINLI